jgi:short-subunit dehydrogenase
VKLDGAVVVVTGASSGFGELSALRFAQRGARVVLAARRLDRLDALAERIAARGGNALAVRCDVTELADLERLRDRTLEVHGRCDVLVNNAGIPGGGMFEDVDLGRLEKVIAVNVLAVVRASKLFLPTMLEQRRGHIVNIASLAGKFATPGAAVYGASKHAVVAFSEALYGLRDRGVLVTAVLPGFSRTETFSGGPRPLTVTPERVADSIVAAVRDGRDGEVWLPRWVRPLELFRIVTPGLYRRALLAGARRAGGP